MKGEAETIDLWTWVAGHPIDEKEYRYPLRIDRLGREERT